MNCNKIKKLLPLFFDGKLGTKEKEQINDHLAICKECYNQKNIYEKMILSLRTPTPVIVPQETVLKLHQKLVEYSWKNEITNQVKKSIRIPWLIPFLSGIGSAALLFIGIYIYFIHTNSVSQQSIPMQTIGSKILQINQKANLRFIINSSDEFKETEIEVLLPKGIIWLTQGQPSKKMIISWKGDLIQGENILSFNVLGVKEGNWQVVLNIKDHNLSRKLTMPVRVEKKIEQKNKKYEL